MQQEIIPLLQSVPAFGGIREDVLELILSRAPVLTAKRGDYFIRENDEANSMFVVLKGKTVVLKLKESKEYFLRFSEAGDCFGEMSLLDLGPRSASVRAVEDTEVLEVSVSDLHAIYEMDKDQYAMMVMNMGREVSRRLREANTRLFEERKEVGGVGEELTLP